MNSWVGDLTHKSTLDRLYLEYHKDVKAYKQVVEDTRNMLNSQETQGGREYCKCIYDCFSWIWSLY